MPTEQMIQNSIYQMVNLKNHRLIVPNCHPFQWESDMVSATRAGFVWEYEIKLSKANFRADFKKARHYNYLTKIDFCLRKGFGLPQRFFYVVPDDMISVGDVPEYAGLMFFSEARNPYNRDVMIKEAPKLHKLPITDRQRQQLERGLVARYWRARVNGKVDR